MRRTQRTVNKDGITAIFGYGNFEKFARIRLVLVHLIALGLLLVPSFEISRMERRHGRHLLSVHSRLIT